MDCLFTFLMAIVMGMTGGSKPITQKTSSTSNCVGSLVNRGEEIVIVPSSEITELDAIGGYVGTSDWQLLIYNLLR